jgi:hypothetical protein
VISQCFNPSCRRELMYLRDGRVVRIIRDNSAGALRVEHFWLCGSCHLQYEFWFTDEKVLSIRSRVRAARPKTEPQIRWIEEPMAS